MSDKREKPKNTHEIQYKIEDRWLIDSICDREPEAVTKAKDLLRDGDKDAVKVIFYRSVIGGFTKERVVFEQTREDFMSSQPRINVNMKTAEFCEGTVEFYELEARLMMRRIFAEWLDRYHITVSELLHNWTYGRKLVESGPALNTAVHKVGTLQGNAAGIAVRARIGQLENHIRRISSRAREHQQWVRGTGLKMDLDNAEKLAERLYRDMDKAAAHHRLTSLICDNLADSPSLVGKLERALEYISHTEDRNLISCLDEVVADCVIVPEVLKEVFGSQPTLAAFLIELSQLLGDCWTPSQDTHPALLGLNGFIKRGISCGSTRRVLLDRLVAEMESERPLDRRDPENDGQLMGEVNAVLRGDTGGRKVCDARLQPAIEARKIRQRVAALRQLGMEDAASELLKKLKDIAA